MNKTPKQTITSMPLNKYIAQAGICSRRHAVELIKDGHVKVNGKVVREPGFKASAQDAVKVKNRLIQSQAAIYVILNKPRGVVTTVSDEHGRPTVIDLIKLPKKQRVYPVGRLDINTTGVLLLTNDGELAQKLAHPSNRIPKVYDVTVHKPIDSVVTEHLKKGVHLKDGVTQVDDCFILPGVKQNKIRIKLHSGKYRIVRRILEHFGYIVEKLDRINFAGISKRGLGVRDWRRLKTTEIKRLKDAL